MSILIKGMAMPTSCRACMFSRTDIRNVDWCVLTEKDLPCDCPIFLVPPHGRLIDERWLKDAMITTLEALKKNPKMDRQEMHLIAAFDTLRCMVEDAPTIIEAEEGET